MLKKPCRDNLNLTLTELDSPVNVIRAVIWLYLNRLLKFLFKINIDYQLLTTER